MQPDDPQKEHTPAIRHTPPDRMEVIRDTLVLQLKLLVDGFRDLLLMPMALLASLYGLLRHADNPGRHLYRLLSYGKASESWIGLFDGADKDPEFNPEFNFENFDEWLKKTQAKLESKYIDPEKKKKIMDRLNATLNEINMKLEK